MKPKRYAWVGALHPDKAAYYRELHAKPWPSILKVITRHHFQNYSIYESAIDGKPYIFAYVEYLGNDFETDWKNLCTDPESRLWEEATDTCMHPLPGAQDAAWLSMPEVFHHD